jgi:hypothetical protein
VRLEGKQAIRYGPFFVWHCELCAPYDRPTIWADDELAQLGVMPLGGWRVEAVGELDVEVVQFRKVRIDIGRRLVLLNEVEDPDAAEREEFVDLAKRESERAHLARLVPGGVYVKQRSGWRKVSNS